jgi:hypothetical protein
MTGEMDSEHGLFPSKEFAHDQFRSRRSTEGVNPTCILEQVPFGETLPACAGPIFLLVPQVQLRKRLDWERDARAAQERIPSAIVANWVEARR